MVLIYSLFPIGHSLLAITYGLSAGTSPLCSSEDGPEPKGCGGGPLQFGHTLSKPRRQPASPRYVTTRDVCAQLYNPSIRLQPYVLNTQARVLKQRKPMCHGIDRVRCQFELDGLARLLQNVIGSALAKAGTLPGIIACRRAWLRSRPWVPQFIIQTCGRRRR